MKKTLLILFCGLFSCSSLLAEIIPLSLKARVDECKYLVMGEVISTTSYWDANHANIYTLHEIKIDAYWKGQNSATYIGLVDLGGQVGSDAQETHPSVSLSVGQYGVFMLGNAIPSDLQSSTVNSSGPNFIQAFPTASIQGAILSHKGKWSDPASPDKIITTKDFLQDLQELTGQIPTSPVGQVVDLLSAKEIKNEGTTSSKTLAVTTLQTGATPPVTTTTFNSGVSNNADMEMIINGTGFGAATGTIEFPDADAGGGTNTFTFPSATNQSNFGAPSDVISWTNSQIRVRVPRNAGTGTMEVFNSANVSQGTATITIDWAIIPVYSTFSGFATETSIFPKLTNEDGNGGYTFRMTSAGSANFFTNTGAKDAFRRAIDTWRCGTLVNFGLDLAAATAVGFASDGISVVMFDNSLPTGVLGRATSRFTANANGLCNMHNTAWRTTEVDIQFQVTPTASTTWNYNNGGTAINQFSFETVALHEIGHGHGLGHVVDVTKVMHFAASNGSQNTTLATTDIAAGQYKVNNSMAPNCLATVLPMTPLVNPCSPLPMDLLSLSAQAIGADNIVNWITANEKNIARYELESSIDGINFSNLGAVNAKMNLSEMEYTYIHKNPQVNTNYYRLKVVDFEEKFNYSNIVSITRGDRNDYAIFPNPTNGDLNISLLGMPQQSNKVEYTITDLNGRIWIQKDATTTEKDAMFTENMENLPSGMYFVQLSINGSLSTQKVVKQ